MIWHLQEGMNPAAVGIIPDFLSESDPRGAVAQLHANYAHGGGWRDFEGFTLVHPIDEIEAYTLNYPGDPPMKEIARAQLRDETIIIFQHSWVVVIESDTGWRCSRMD